VTTVTESAIANRLLEAAVQLFANKGYPATSTREIVEAAGVTKPMLYYYFQSKEGLLAAALGHFIKPFHERLGRVLEETHDPRRLLVELVWAHLDFCQQHKPFARLFYALFFGPDDQKNLIDLKQLTQPGHELLSQGVERAAAAGLVTPECRERFTTALHGMINIWVIVALNEHVAMEQDLARQVVDDLLQGFRAI
jgi:AcrR family transcriptional regulator